MKRRTYGLLYTVIIACMSIAHAQQMTNADPRVADLVRAGKVRIGVIPSDTVLQGFKRGTEGDRHRNGPHACGTYRDSRRDHGRIFKPSSG